MIDILGTIVSYLFFALVSIWFFIGIGFSARLLFDSLKEKFKLKDEQEVYDECGLSDEMNAALGQCYFIVKPTKEDKK